MNVRPNPYAPRTCFRASALAVAVLSLLAIAAPAQLAPEGISSGGAPLRYTVELKDASQHLVHVRLLLPASGVSQRDVALPVWNATYQVRDFAQYVNHVRASNCGEAALPLRQLDKTTWRVWAAASAACIDYDETLDLAGPFGAQFNEHHAFFNLALALMYPRDGRAMPVEVTFQNVPPGWQAATMLSGCTPDAGERDSTRFCAANYDRLVDGPVELGTFKQAGFDADGAHFTVAVDADPADYNLDAIVAMLRKVVATEIAWMDDRPFTRYTFIYHFPHGPAGGGMEHAYGTAIDASVARAKDPAELASVSAHEFFHLWNVKRIRPQSLEPVDYSKEQYTRALWFSEGFTNTIADYTLLRAGFDDEARFLQNIARAIDELESSPAHLTMSPEQSSLTAWFEKYPSYYAPDRSVSYYTQGEVLGVLLDLAMLDASSGRRSLRDLFHALNQQYAKQGRYFDDTNGVRDTAEVLTGRSFRDFFEKYVAGAEPIPYDDFFRTVGLRLERSTGQAADPGFTFSRAPGATAGTVGSVVSPGPADRAGLHAGDVVVTVNGQPLASSPLVPRRRGATTLKPGVILKLNITRNGRPQELTLTVGSRDQPQYALVDLDPVTPAQRARRDLWLGKSEALAAPASGATSTPGR